MTDPSPQQREALLKDLRAATAEEDLLVREGELSSYSRDLWPKLTIRVRDQLPNRPPVAVVRPRDEAACLRVLEVLAKHGSAAVPFGAGSGVCGGAAPLFGGVVIDLKHLDSLSSVDPGTLQVTCGPGRILQRLEEDLNASGYTLGHFPSSIYCASIGGCVAARGAGQLSSRYGKIEDMVTGLHIATPGLGLIQTGSLDANETNPDWTGLFVGSEGTLGLITRIRLRVHPLPATMHLRGVRFPSVEAGLAAFREILQGGLRPSVMRLYDPLDTWMAMQKNNDVSEGDSDVSTGGGHPMLGGARPAQPENAQTPSGGPQEGEATPRVFGSVVSPGTLASGVLGRLRRRGRTHRSVEKDSLLGGAFDRLIGDKLQHLLKPENIPAAKLLGNPALLNKTISLLPGRSLAIFGCEGDDEVARQQLDAVIRAAQRLGGVDLGSGPGERWFRTRYHVAFKLPKLLAGGGFADTFETAIPWTKVEALYAAVHKAVSPHALVMAHFSHAYHEGCSIYFTLVGYGAHPEATEAVYGRIWDAALGAALATGATITHHHGVGVLKRDFMDGEHGDARTLFEAARSAVDPERLMNPGKLFPKEIPPKGPEGPPIDPFMLDVGAHEDGVVQVGVGWRGVDLAAELELRGHFLPPLGRRFLESRLHDWLASPALPAQMAVHGTWEHPLLAAEGRLEDRRVWRSGRLPRSAAGPSYLPFAVGGGDSHLPLETAKITLRTCTPPILRHIGFRFSHMDRAVLALATTLRSGPVPLAGAVFPGSEPSSWRRVATDEPEGRSGGTIYLTFAEPDGFPSGGDSVTAALREAGGELFDDSEVLAWWEDHWAQPAREGASGLPATGILRPDTQIGSCRAAVSWKQALLLLRSIESLTGGATSAIGWIEAPREAGCSIEWRFTCKRKDAEAPALVGYQLRATLRAHGARIEAFDFDAEPDLPAYTVAGRGSAADSETSEMSNATRLTAGIREHLEANL
jgi:alkyldihydroxyacetonephosphate synthase